MATKTETQVSELKINILSESDYNTALANGEINEDELYLTQATGSVVPSGGESGQILGWESSGTAKWCNEVSDLVVNGTISKGRKSGTTIGTGSIAIGENVEASGNYSHAEGCPFTLSIHAYTTEASGRGSHAEGCGNIASGEGSHAEGYGTEASGKGSHAEGAYIAKSMSELVPLRTTASGNYSHAEGVSTTASGECSHTEGYNTKAIGKGSHAEGWASKANGNYSHAEGHGTEALNYQHTQGHYNDTSLAVAGESDGTTGTAFVIGNGTSNAASNACRITYAGAVIGKAAYASTGADMAEFREWLDGNPDNEDRRGYFVTMDGMNIKIAEPGDYICGIISANPSLIGNNDEAWMGRYVFDDFGAFVYEDYEETDPETGETHTYTHYKLNPDYDPTRTYEFRADRPEWDYVGLCGVINTRDDGTCEVNGFCKCGEGGVATASERGYRVLERVNDNVVKVLFYLTGEIF